jgi:hypothetical protein
VKRWPGLESGRIVKFVAVFCASLTSGSPSARISPLEVESVGMQLTVNRRRASAGAIVISFAMLGVLPAAGQSGIAVSRPLVASGYLKPEQRAQDTVVSTAGALNGDGSQP